MFILGLNNFSDMRFNEFEEQLTGLDPKLTQIDDQSVKLVVDRDEIWILPKFVG